jgi:hypothetical protein
MSWGTAEVRQRRFSSTPLIQSLFREWKVNRYESISKTVSKTSRDSASLYHANNISVHLFNFEKYRQGAWLNTKMKLCDIAVAGIGRSRHNRLVDIRHNSDFSIILTFSPQLPF